jgi:pseudaminic acid cytidylyltransferase
VGSIAIIPARGGSKRIPGKNIKSFEGVPIIAYAIRAARESGLFDVVMTSTDSDEIANIARSFGADVPFMRSAATANDTASTIAVLLEVIDRYAQQGKHFERGCCIYPCNPLLTPKLLELARGKLESEGFDCVFTAVRYNHAVQRSFVIEQGRMRLLFPEHRDTRTQDLAPVFHDAGQFYFFRTGALLAHETLWTGNTGVIEVAESDAQDIDTLEDWSLAAVKYRAMRARGADEP